MEDSILDSPRTDVLESPSTGKKITNELQRTSVEIERQQQIKGINFLNMTSRFNNRVFPINIDKDSKYR